MIVSENANVPSVAGADEDSVPLVLLKLHSTGSEPLLKLYMYEPVVEYGMNVCENVTFCVATNVVADGLIPIAEQAVVSGNDCTAEQL